MKKVQQALNDAGYNCGTPDGIAGKKTAAAITQYRTEKGLEVNDTIDDALLDAMGIEAPQAETEQSGTEDPSQENAEQTASSRGGDLNDYKVMAHYYNNAFAAKLAELGVEGDIGQEAHKMTSAEQVWGEKTGFRVVSEKNDDISWGFNYVPSLECNVSLENALDEDRLQQPLTFLEYVEASAMIEVINRYFNGTEEDLAGALALLGDAPSQDGTATIDSNGEYSCKEYALELTGDSWGYGTLMISGGLNYGLELENRLEGDDVPEVPEEVIQATGGIPDVMNEQWKKYSYIEEWINENEYGTYLPYWASDNYNGNMEVGVEDREDENGNEVFGKYVVTINAIDSENNHFRWYAAYDESGNMIEKSYEY